MTITAGAAQVEVTPAFPAWRRKVSAEVTGPHMTALGRRGGEQVTTGFESGTSRLGEGLKRGVRTGLVSLGAMGTAAGVLGLKTAAAGENAEIAFTTMLKSGSKARKFLGELKAFAATTPFELPELQTASQSLVSAGVNADKVIPIMRTLGNVTAGMGTGQEGIKRATVAIQQMQAAQKISGEDLNQLRDAGIPVYDLLAKSTGRAKGEVVELARQGKLGKKDLDAMMRGLETGKGLERFNGMMGKQSKSLAGMWSTLKDTTTMGLADAVQPLLPTVKKGLGGLTKLVEQNAPRLRSGMQALVDGGPRITAFFRSLNTAENRAAFTGLKDSFASLGPAMSQAKGEGPRLASVLNGVASAVRFTADHVDTLVKYAPTFLGLLAGYKLLQGANNLLGRQSAIGMGMQVTATLSLAASNRALAASQKAVAVSQGQANAAEKVGLLTRIRTRAATIASTIAERAATVAKKAGAIATRVLNAAMRMNPLGIVITALTALGVGLVIAYKKSATFRRVVDGAFSKVKAVASSVVGWFRSTAWPWLSRFFTDTGARARSLYTRYIGPAFSKIGAVSRSVFGWIRNTGWPWVRTALSAIGGAVRTLWSKAIKPYFGFFLGIYKRVFGWLKNTGAPWALGALRAIGSGAKTLWTKWISPYFSRVRTGAGKLVDAFKSAKDGIGKAWGGLKDTISKPIRTALGWVNDHFIGPINTMLSKVGAGFSVPTIQIGGGQQKTRVGNTPSGVDRGTWQARADGGPITGYSPHKRADNIRALLTAGEFVQPVDTVRHYGAAAMEAVRQRKADIVPRYASGGLVYQQMASWLKRAVPGAVVTSTNGGKHATNSLHYDDKAIDIGGSPSVMRAAASAIQRSFGSKILELIHNPGFSIKNGKRVSPGFWGGGTWAGHANHVHWAMNALTGGSALGGGFLTGLAKKVLEKGKGALDALLSKAPKGLWGSAMVGVGKKMTQNIYDKVLSTLESAGDPSAPGGGVERWRSLVVKALGMVGQPISLANVTLRRMMQESGGNARAINDWDSNAAAGTPSKGLMQVIGPTFRAYAMKGYNRDIWDPLSNILASMRYALARYGSLAAAYNRAGGYTSGTHNASPGPHWVGEHGRELVWFRGGERVTSANRSRQITSSAPRGPVEMRGRLTIDPAGVAWFEGVAENVFNDMSDGASALAGMGGRG